MPLPEDVVADDPRYASEHPSHHNQIHAAINDLEALAGTLSDVETTSGSQGKVDTHALDMTSVHGISDTAQVPAKNTANTFTLDQTFNTNVKVKGPYPWADVTAFGAVGDGTTDDTAAIQAALNSGAQRFYFPTGNYRLASSLTLPGHYKIFMGHGSERSRLHADSGVDIFNVSTGWHALFFKNLQFEGQATPAGSSAFAMPGTGPIGGSNYFGAEFEDCWFKNLTSAIDLGSTTTEVTGLSMLRTQFLNAPLRLVNSGPKNVMKFYQCRWAGMTQTLPAVEFTNTVSGDVLVEFYSCTWESNVRQSVILNNVSLVLFESCYFEMFVDTTAPWVDLQGSTSHVTLRQCFFADPNATGQVMIGSSTSPSGPFYGIVLDHLYLGAGPPGNIQRSKFNGLVELGSPATQVGHTEFRHPVKFTAYPTGTDSTRWEVTDTQLRSFYQSETEPRIYLHRLEGLALGDGASTVDTKIQRLGANLAGTASGDKFVANAGLGVGNSAAATTSVGALARKMEVFDAAGASLGFIPIYSTIT